MYRSKLAQVHIFIITRPSTFTLYHSPFNLQLLPLSRFYHFFHLAFDGLTLQSADMADEELAVQVIDFMAKSSRQQSLSAHGEFLAVDILGANSGTLGTRRL